MENTAILLIAVTLFLLVIIIGLLTALIFRLFKNPIQQTPEQKTDFHPAILERMKEVEKAKKRKPDLFCPNHPEEPGEVLCAICDKHFCKVCVKPFKTMHLCKEHLPLLMRNEWEEVITVKATSDDPEEGVRLFELKKKIYDEKQLPTYVETHYKINVDQDHIETYLVVFAMKENVEVVKRELETI